MAKRGRKPKDKKNYFGEEEEKAVIEYIELSRLASGYTCQLLEIIFDCTPEELASKCSGHSLFDVTQEAEGIKIEDETEKKTITALRKEIENINSKKNNIYNTILHPSFVKMIESLIRRYKLFIPDESFEKTFDDTLSNLSTKMDKYDPSKGTKAYSYFGTVCVNYLKAKSIKFSKEQKRSASFDEHIEELSNNTEYYNQSYSEEDNTASKVIKAMSNKITEMIDNKEENKLTDSEVKVGMAIVELLNNWEELLPDEADEPNDKPYKVSNKLRKSKILYFLRETSMMTTKEVRDNMKVYKCIYPLIKRDCLEDE